MFMQILIGLVLLIAVVLLYATIRPDTFRLERSISVNASPQKAYALLEDFHLWAGWSPWEKMDPNMQRTYSGTSSGVGAIYEWQGKKVGQGRMEIMEAIPTSKVIIKLDFVKPMEAHNTTEFTLTPQGGTTQVNWAMYGRNNLMAKVMQMFISMDKMVGKDFEAGLASLKTLAEK
jgi:carbon monoxide dehydrogenase subunit G